MEKTKKAFRVSARLYSEVAKFAEWDKNHEFPHYEEIAGTERKFDLEGATLRNGTEVISLKTAEMWMLENHPDYMQGCCIVQKVDKNADFLMTAVPCNEYLDGYFENYENRRLYAERKAKQMGVVIGQETAKDVLGL